MRFRNLPPKLREFGSFFGDLVKTFAVVNLGMTYGYSFSICVGPSMLPTISERGDIVFIDHISYIIFRKDYKRGDVVISVSPNDPHRAVCKRITGIEGDIIPTNRSNSFFDLQEVVIVPRGHVWLAGDNPSNSTDSRQYGPVPIGLIQGRVVAKTTFTEFFKRPFAFVSSGLPPYLKNNNASTSTKNSSIVSSPNDDLEGIVRHTDKSNSNSQKDSKNNESAET